MTSNIHLFKQSFSVLTLQLRMAPTLQSRPICCRLEFWRSLRIAGDNVHRHRISWLLNCAPSSETIANSSSDQQLGISTFFSIAPHPPFLLLIWSSRSPSYFIHPLSHPPINPPIHPHIYTPSIQPSTHSFIQERMGR